MTKNGGISESYPKGEQVLEEGTAVPGYTSEVGTRISAAIRAVGGRRNAASIVGVSDDTIDKWKSGGTRPSFFGMKALAEAAGVSMDWLAGLDSGDAGDVEGGPDIVARDANGATHAIEAKDSSGLSGQGDFVLLPRYEVRAAAGGGAVVHSEQVVDYLAFKREWVANHLGRNQAGLVLIEAFGSSMEPKIYHGDLLLVDTSIERIRDQAVYALNIWGELLVKYVSRLPGGGVRVFSENPNYPSQDLSEGDAKQLVVVGQVVWVGGVLRPVVRGGQLTLQHLEALCLQRLAELEDDVAG
mgnify:FL=1